MKPPPRLLCVSPPDAAGASAWVARAPALVDAGADGLLLRVLDDAAPVEAWARSLAAAGLPLVLHSRTPGGVELAALLGAGLHLPGGADPASFRARCPGWLGQSCHTEAGLDAASACDYALLSPVFAPGSKPDDVRPLLGLGGLARATARRALPVLALGGIGADNAAATVAAGAWGVAGIGLGTPAAVRAIRRALSPRPREGGRIAR